MLARLADAHHVQISRVTEPSFRASPRRDTCSPSAREARFPPSSTPTAAGCSSSSSAGRGRGRRSLVAELIVGLIAAAAGLPAPELAIVDILPAFGRSEPDPEIQEILGKSHGVNVGLRYLDGAFNFDASAAGEYVSSELATKLVWFDAFVTNPDRTHRNPNLLIWNKERLAHRPWCRALCAPRLALGGRRANGEPVPADQVARAPRAQRRPRRRRRGDAPAPHGRT